MFVKTRGRQRTGRKKRDRGSMVFKKGVAKRFALARIRWLHARSSLFIFLLLEGRGSLALVRLSDLKTSTKGTHILIHVKAHQI